MIIACYWTTVLMHRVFILFYFIFCLEAIHYDCSVTAGLPCLQCWSLHIWKELAEFVADVHRKGYRLSAFAWLFIFDLVYWEDDYPLPCTFWPLKKLYYMAFLVFEMRSMVARSCSWYNMIIIFFFFTEILYCYNFILKGLRLLKYASRTRKRLSTPFVFYNLD